ncbi:aminoglycoside phosphotransferase family protein [Paenibacillus sp. Marseille-Q4541]|uniref:aminoglycoside phosphotransferase family protein n=1 Tax=Paenibacillus sp. Marseille-Q4541 TaxID=2831522 RepID=UPI001BA516F5|nr:aminoglycoside phosphotransferase family protein [Paenibacillus sp. Marseille-Q4541]
MVDINAELVRKLINAQFAKWSDLPIKPVEKSGHDNRTFHLGDRMTVRMPSEAHYAPQVDKELHWLPKLRPHLTLPISTPLEKGEPTLDYPYPWSINEWIEGETVHYDRVNDLNRFANDLAKFLLELQAIDTSGGPVAGKHNFYRGGLLSVYDKETQTALEMLKTELPTDKLKEIWSIALESKWQKDSVWVHGDIAPGNLLVKDGKLCAVIDFGVLGIGDPSCDYAIAWTFFDQENRTTFYHSLGCDKGTWNRARGWALWKALITYKDKDQAIAVHAKRTIDAILEEYSLSK